VQRLRDAADRARPLAEEAGRLTAALDTAGRTDPAPVLVVDRAGWAHAAAQSMFALAGSSLPAGRAVTAQLAGALAILGPRVLGQFDPYYTGTAGSAAGDDAGRLLLVAPNVQDVGRAMAADPDDFALWVCVHEQTHALQFASAPWLAGHLRSEAGALLEALTGPDQDGAAGSWLGVLRGDVTGLAAMLGEEQRERLMRITAVMSLLEGHADVAMDDVPVWVIPSRRQLRERMEARRSAAGAQKLLRRLLGMDAKLAQYREGAAFVREVRRAAHDALDVVWTAPEALPSAAEIADPAEWLRRTRS
jgi:coenzyme F420 biosynthesis associated uncharacterized protein